MDQEYPAIPQQQPVPVRPIYTAVPVPVEDKEEEEERGLVKWVKSNFFALIGLIASLLTLYASSQVKPLAMDINHLKEQILEIKTANAQVLGIMDTKYADKEMTDLQYQTLNNSLGDVKKSLDTLIELHTTNKSK